MKKRSFILLIITALILFSSCRSVYVTPAPPETTVSHDGSSMFIQNIIGDWMLITKYNYDKIIGQTHSLISYNLKTGESL